MTTYTRNSLTYVWAFLAIITLVSWWIGRGRGAEFHINPTVTIGVLIIAAVKTQCVIRYFMEVRFAPVWLRTICTCWLILTFVLLISLYYIHA